jgi:hypothetical protein
VNPIQKAIEDFLNHARRPCLCEPGEQPIALTASNFQIADCGSGLLLEAWNEKYNLARRVTGLQKPLQRGRLTLKIEKFGKKTGTLALIDQDSAAQYPAGVRHHRQEFLQLFGRFLRRQFPSHSLDELTTSPDLHETLSPFFPRALIRLGTSAWAAIGAPPDALRADGVLSFGLIWLDYLRRRHPNLRLAGLILYLPQARAQITCLRLTCLDRRNTQYRAFLYSPEGDEYETDPSDHGNLSTHMQPATDSPNRPSYSRNPEAWLESQVRNNIQALDPQLLPSPVYDQVQAFAATDCGVLDLVACDRDGRLAVIELKAFEDLHLPLQALDYWLRIKWHLDRQDFRKNGYFPAVELRPIAPRLLLISPALDMHPTNERILRYFSPSIQWERIGVSVEWRKKVKVVFRTASPCQ